MTTVQGFVATELPDVVFVMMNQYMRNVCSVNIIIYGAQRRVEKLLYVTVLSSKAMLKSHVYNV